MVLQEHTSTSNANIRSRKTPCTPETRTTSSYQYSAVTLTHLILTTPTRSLGAHHSHISHIKIQETKFGTNLHFLSTHYPSTPLPRPLRQQRPMQPRPLRCDLRVRLGRVDEAHLNRRRRRRRRLHRRHRLRWLPEKLLGGLEDELLLVLVLLLLLGR